MKQSDITVNILGNISLIRYRSHWRPLRPWRENDVLMEEHCKLLDKVRAAVDSAKESNWDLTVPQTERLKDIRFTIKYWLEIFKSNGEIIRYYISVKSSDPKWAPDSWDLFVEVWPTGDYCGIRSLFRIPKNEI